MQSTSGIEVDYSLNDLDVSTQYDVDDSVYVYEEICGDPQLTTIQDYREVSGGGKKDLKQGFSSGRYAATSGVKADSGSVESSATLTSTSLSATQRSNIGGSFAQSLLAGSMGYLGGIAFTGQYVGVASGILSTVQTLSLGQSIYSTQNFQASGNFPLAVGYALVGFGGLNGNDVQGAFIAAGACEEGSISGYMGAEVIRVPDAQYVDPVAYGSNMVARGDKAAGIIAGAGNLNEFWAQNQFANFNGLLGQGAITGAVGIGEDSFASVDYIEARTDGHETSAFEVDAKAKGDDAAIVAAGAGSFSRKIGIGIYPTLFFYNKIFDMQGSIAGATAIGDDSKANADFIGAITDGERTSAGGIDLLAKGDGFAAVGAGAGSFYRNQGLMQSPFFFYAGDNFGLQGALAGAAAGGKKSKASADFIGALTDGETTFAEGYNMRARGDKFAATGAGALSIRKGDYSFSPVWPYYQDTQGAIVGDIGLGEDSFASADYVGAETDGDQTSAVGIGLMAGGKRSAHAIAGAGEDIYLDNGVLKIEQGSATGLNALDNGAVSAALMYAGTGDITESYGFGMQASGDESALAYTASGDKLTVWADLIRVKDGTLAGLGAKGAMSRVYADRLFSSKAGPLSTSHGINLNAHGDGAIAASASGEKVDLMPDKADVDTGSLTGAAANGDATVISAGLASFKSPVSTLSTGEMLEAYSDKSAVLATGKGSKVTIKADEDEGRARVDQGTIAGVAAYKNAWVSGDELASGDIDIDIGTLVMDGEGSVGQGLLGMGEKSASTASGAGDRVVIKADKDEGKAEVDQGSIAGVTAYKNALVGSGLLASGEMQLAVGPQALDGKGSVGEGLLGWGEKSASAASGAGDRVVIKADKDEGKAEVDQGSITGLTAYKNALVVSGLLASGEIQLDFGSPALDGKGSVGEGLLGWGDKSASSASGVGEKVVIKSNDELGRAKVTNGGITGMAAHDGAVVGAGLMGSAGLTDGTVAGWIGVNPSATGTMSALGTGSGSEVNVEADAAIVETTKGSIIGITASGANSITSADSIGGYKTALFPTLAATNVLAQGDSASAASAISLLSTAIIESDKITVKTGSVVGMAAENGEVTADSLDVSSLTSSSGLGLKASGDKSTAIAAAGNVITIQPDSSTVTSPVIGSAAMVGLGASGSSEVSASSLEASNDAITLTAKGSVLQASGQNYAMIGVAASGSITGGSLISFLPSSGASPYYGMTIPRGAYGGGRASGGTVTIDNTVMAKASGTDYVIGGPGATTTNKDYANIQATGTQPVVFAAYRPKSIINPDPSVTTKTDGLTHQIWAFKSATDGNKEVI